ncbi:Dos2-interacting transcription regulator of RNA-Pol-II-domain-containing protein [Coniochaeta sp. 2T2.1]|nr:Dos2-interacting transcription regulator of RNA-Pol-II-domain-containing protein [Coniochaeta sp. 2T2.1]
MASFDELALQYVVLDDEEVMRDMAAQAAKAIEDAGANRIAVGNWAASIKLWIAPGLKEDQDGESGNAITRAKAISFLATTLELLNKDLLKADQVDLLIGFFGSMFSNDHKAGITPAAKALQQLATAKNFKPQMGVKIVEEVTKIKEDFRLQTAATRLEVYQLLLRLIQDSAVASELEHKYGASSGFIVDLLSMCQHERDPRDLLVWFKIISVLVSQYSPSEEVVAEIFKAFANYFPITLRESTTQIGVTAEDLKASLRECFSSHQRLAYLAFPYLIQRLDQGDSMKVTVKNDILMTMKACIDNYRNPQASVIPYIPSIWNSLKYEVRNGEVAETVESATLVLRAVGVVLQNDPVQLNDYVHLVFRDSLEDLGEPNYAKQAGQLCLAVISSSPQAFVPHSRKLVDSVIQQIPQFGSATYATYTRDLLDLLKSILRARHALVQFEPDHKDLLAAESAAHFQTLFHKVYLPIWHNNITSESGPELNLLREVTSGVALLAKQQIATSDGQRALLCSTDVFREICSLFTQRLLMPLTLSRRDAVALNVDAPIGLEEALAVIMSHYIEGFQTLVATTTEAILDRQNVWSDTSRCIDLWTVISAVSYVGCSLLPDEIALTSGAKKYSSLHHFMVWTGALLQLTEAFLTGGSAPRPVRFLVGGLQHAMCTFQEACEAETKQLNLLSDGTDSLDWAREFKKITAGADIPTEWRHVLASRYPDIYDQLRQGTTEGSQSAPPSDEGTYANFIRLSLFIIRHMCRRLTKQSQGDDGKTRLYLADDIMAYPEKRRTPILTQVERMGPMIIQALDAASQQYYSLSTEAFRLFSDCNLEAPYWSVNTLENGALNLLTLSILKGLWPAAMADIYQPNGIARAILYSDRYTTKSISQTQACIVALLVNKYKESPSSISLKDAVQFWQSRLEQDIGSYGEENAAAGVDIERMLSLLVGGIPRQEKAILPLIPLVHKVIGLTNSVGQALAREIETVVDENEYLSTEAHAVIRPLFKQWTYAHLVKPMIPLAATASSDVQESWWNLNRSAEHYTIATMAILRHMPFAVYEADVEPLTNMCLTTLNHWTRNLRHVENTLHTLLQIMRNDPNSLRYTLRAIISALMKAYNAKLRPSASEFEKPPRVWTDIYVNNLAQVTDDLGRHHPEREGPHPEPYSIDPERLRREEEKAAAGKYAACRKMVIEIVGEMPARFEDRYLMPFKGDMNLFLDGCCGDPVRELRRAAVEAKEGWFGC